MKNSEQPINPLPSDVDSSKVECIGLTKREYFAAMAMQGMLANSSYTDSIEGIAKAAVAYSDALLAELDKPATHAN